MSPSPLRVGTAELQLRVVMAPLKHSRANEDHIYTQYSRVPGALVISEATFIPPQAAGYASVPGIWNGAQIAGWKMACISPRPTTTVLRMSFIVSGSYMFLQIWALGRTADPAVLRQEGGFDLITPSPISLGSGGTNCSVRTCGQLAVAEIKEYVRLYSKAASNAIEVGFDGVEVHAAIGYLLDQFLQTVSNERTDGYGGGVIKVVVETVGAERTAIRISPWSKFQGMRIKDPLRTFTTFIERIQLTDENRAQINEVLRKIWGHRPYIAAGGMDGAIAINTVEKYGGLVAFDRHFIGNPFLRPCCSPIFLCAKAGLSPTRYNCDTFYATEAAAGYIE
ncbi:putative NADPH2 dehydrogenase chain OYE2 [Lactarius psammicola]|nr:putative NADPH2 dehydrogenase chain OYE2 [Lactarius psammicola]